MNVLSSTTLVDAMKTCDTNEGARIGIVCSSMVAAKALIVSFCNEISDHRMPGWIIEYETGHYRAKLRRYGKNEDSTIEIFSATSVSDIRGRAYHQVLYDQYLAGPLIIALMQCERLSFGSIEDCNSKELDEFLESFKIV